MLVFLGPCRGVADGSGPRHLANLSAMEMPVEPARVVELLYENASILKEDVTHLEAGTFKFQAFGVDVTKEQAARLRANLSRLEQVIEALQSDFI